MNITFRFVSATKGEEYRPAIWLESFLMPLLRQGAVFIKVCRLMKAVLLLAQVAVILWEKTILACSVKSLVKDYKTGLAQLLGWVMVSQ